MSAARNRLVLMLSIVLAAGALVALPGVRIPADAAARPAKVKGVKLRTAWTSGTSTVRISWRKARGAKKYRVLLSTNPSMRRAKTFTVSSTKKSFAKRPTTQLYCVQVRAVNRKRLGKKSAVACTVPMVLTGWAQRQSPTSLALTWPRAGLATSYQIVYAQSPTGKSISPSGARGRRVVTATGTTRLIGGLQPGATYCFQIRGRTSKTVGLNSPPRCKVTMRSDRARPGSAALAVGTFNTCSKACAARFGSWGAGRGAAAHRRIQQMRVGGRPVDVLSIQEEDQATPDLAQNLSGFSTGCRTQSPKQYDDLTSVFVRRNTYRVIGGSQGHVTFDAFNDPKHGACWVKVADVATGKQIVVASYHLFTDRASDAVRARQVAYLLQAIRRQHPSGPVVLAGDANSNRSRRYDAPRDLMGKQGFHDAYDQAAAYEGLPFINSGCLEMPKICYGFTWGDHVDTIYASAGLHIASWKNDYRLAGNRFAAPVLSDHNPVLGLIRF